jgi:hypothetical protein
MSLSERIRANSEAAPWVIEEVVKMEAEIERLNGLLLRAVERGEECVEMVKDLLKNKDKP